MAKRSYVIRHKSFIWALLLYALMMQNVITQFIPSFKYADEVAALAFLLYFVLELRTKYLSKMDLRIALLCASMCMLGFLGNYFSGISVSLKYKILDAFNIFKYVMVIWGAVRFFNKYQTKKYLIHYLAVLVKSTVLISTVFMILNLFMDVGMHTDYRLGIRTFNFIFTRVGEMYQACILWIIILTAEQFYNKTKWDYLYMALALINMMSTLRSRAIAFAGLFVIVYYVLIYRKNVKLNIWHILGIGLMILPIGVDQLEYYLFSDSRARSVLLQYGIVTATNYFPFGAGFGTYGTAVARDIYSDLYYEYDFSSVWGLAPGGSFLTDNYWPAVLGEFGYFGTVLNAFLIYSIIRKLLSNTDNPYSKVCVYFAMGTLLISSTVGSSFFACAQLMIFVCLVCKMDYSQICGNNREDINDSGYSIHTNL